MSDGVTTARRPLTSYMATSRMMFCSGACQKGWNFVRLLRVCGHICVGNNPADYEVWGRKELHAENSYMWWVVPLFACTVSTPHTLQHSAAHTLHIPGWQFPCSTPRMDWKRIFGRDYICAKVGAFTYTPHSRWTYCVRILQCSIYDAHMHALKHTYVCTYIQTHRKGT